MNISNSLLYTVLIFNLIIATIIIYYLLKNNTNFFKRKPYFTSLTPNDYQTVINNWKTFGFSKIKNYIAYDIDYINDYINFVEKKYPKMINTMYNNNLVSNINRKTIELVRDENGAPFPFALGEKKYLEVEGFPNREQEQNFFENLGDNNYLQEQGINNLSDEAKEMISAENVRRTYFKDSRKIEFFNFLKLFSDKLKKSFPDIIKFFYTIFFLNKIVGELNNYVYLDDYHLKTQEATHI